MILLLLYFFWRNSVCPSGIVDFIIIVESIFFLIISSIAPSTELVSNLLVFSSKSVGVAIIIMLEISNIETLGALA